MRVLEALRTLETAVIESKRRAVDTPEVREALDLLEPYCDTGMASRRLSRALEASRGNSAQAARAAAKPPRLLQRHS